LTDDKFERDLSGHTNGAAHTEACTVLYCTLLSFKAQRPLYHSTLGLRVIKKKKKKKKLPPLALPEVIRSPQNGEARS